MRGRSWPWLRRVVWPPRRAYASGGTPPPPQPPPPPPFWQNLRELLQRYSKLGPALVLFGGFAMWQASRVAQGSTVQEISFKSFKSTILPSEQLARVEVINGTSARVFLKGDANSARYFFQVPSVETFERQMVEAQHDLGFSFFDYVPVTYVTELNYAVEALKLFGPTLMTLGLMYGAMTMMKSGAGGMFGAPGQSTAKLINKETGITTTFKDVAGLFEAKQEVMEFVSFLKNPAKYEALGARIPKGALLVGPPGTGKTLLAKATAGEAGVPFFSVSGSEFQEMFVGVGPARVRDLFKKARAAAPSIIWIDEIDAVGRARSTMGGGNDERENTLNQLLVEMDGFDALKGVVVLAGTNRADVLDKALLRPGRFDRQVTVDLPDLIGRRDIFMVHMKPLTISDPTVTAKRLASLTPGMSGADIASVCNEAALIAARTNKAGIEAVDFEAAIERLVGGIEKKSKVIAPNEKAKIAYHEAGHAIVGWFLEHCDPLLKVSIVPRGAAALGYAQYLPRDRFLLNTLQLRDRMCMALGGRVAEELKFGELSTGAQDDLRKITRQVYAQITRYGMNDKLGNIAFPDVDDSNGNYQKPYSEKMAKLIDSEARKLVEDAYQRTRALLQSKLAELEALAQLLLEKEVLRMDDLVATLGQRPFEGQRKSLDEISDELIAEAEQRIIKDENRKD